MIFHGARRDKMKKVLKKSVAAFMAVCAITAVSYAGEINTCAASSLESLGNPVAGEDGTADYVQNPFDAATSGVEVEFKYEPHETYRIYCQDGFVTDIKFQPGEKVTYVGAGDTTRWVIDRSSAGSGATRLEHVYVKPIKRGLSTNIVINTNMRTYQITAISGSQYNPMVSWVVEKSMDDLNKMIRAREIENMMTVNAANLHFNYRINNSEYKWAPTMAFDDGQKTYLKMKPEIKSSTAPIFMVEEHGKSILVNYRVVGGYYIIDRVFGRGNLMVGTDKVRISNRD
jgi:type IV secretion system protein VirB9